MEIPTEHLKLKVHPEVVVYRVQAPGSSDGTLGCFCVSSRRLVERPSLSATSGTTPDPADLQVVRVTRRPPAVTLRGQDGREVTLDTEPSAERRQALSDTLLAALARATLKAERAEAATAATIVPSGPPLGRAIRTSRAVKRPPGLSIVNPSVRKRPTAAGVSFESDSQE